MWHNVEELIGGQHATSVHTLYDRPIVEKNMRKVTAKLLLPLPPQVTPAPAALLAASSSSSSVLEKVEQEEQEEQEEEEGQEECLTPGLVYASQLATARAEEMSVMVIQRAAKLAASGSKMYVFLFFSIPYCYQVCMK